MSGCAPLGDNLQIALRAKVNQGTDTRFRRIYADGKLPSIRIHAAQT
jgi:hypothetical protein